MFLGINFSRLRETFFFQDFFYDDKKDEPVNKALKATSWMFIVELMGCIGLHFLWDSSLLKASN